MSLYNQIMEEAKAAMLAKDSIRLTVLKSIKAAFTNELLSRPISSKKELTDSEALSVIKRLVKQRKDSIVQFRAGRREDLARTEEAELNVLEKYLPVTMSEEEIEVAVKKKKNELGITEKTKAGILMAAIMKELKDKADGADVKKAVDELFS